MSGSLPINQVRNEFWALEGDLQQIRMNVQAGQDSKQLLSETEKLFKTLEGQLNGKVPNEVLESLKLASSNLVEIVRDGVKSPEVWEKNIDQPIENVRQVVFPPYEEEGGPSGAA